MMKCSNDRYDSQCNDRNDVHDTSMMYKPILQRMRL